MPKIYHRYTVSRTGTKGLITDRLGTNELEYTHATELVLQRPGRVITNYTTPTVT